MHVAKSLSTPFQIRKAIENLSEAERETLSIMADETLSEELMKRRQEAVSEMKNDELVSEEELFRNSKIKFTP